MRKIVLILQCFALACVLSTGSFAETSKPYSGETVTILTRMATFDAWNKVVEKIQDKTGITINTVTATVEYSDYVTKVNAALAIGDDTYDILDVDELLGVAYQAAGYLEPINQVIETHGEYYLGTWLENISKGDDGNYYLLPQGYSGIYLYINKGLFASAGVAIPTTQDEFIAAAQAITDQDNSVFGLGSSWMQGGYMFNDIQRLIKAFEGDFYNWDDTGTRKAIQFMYDQINTFGITPKSAISEDYSSTNQKFADNKYGMIFMWQNGYTTVADKWDNYEIIMIPTFDRAVTIMNSWGLGINVNSKHKEAAKAVLMVMAEYDVQLLELEMEYTQHKDVLASKEAATEPVLVALSNYSEAGIIEPREMPVYVNEIQNIMETNVSAYVSGQISLDECCANVNFGFEDLK